MMKTQIYRPRYEVRDKAEGLFQVYDLHTDKWIPDTESHSYDSADECRRELEDEDHTARCEAANAWRYEF